MQNVSAGSIRLSKNSCVSLLIKSTKELSKGVGACSSSALFLKFPMYRPHELPVLFAFAGSSTSCAVILNFNCKNKTLSFLKFAPVVFSLAGISEIFKPGFTHTGVKPFDFFAIGKGIGAIISTYECLAPLFTTFCNFRSDASDMATSLLTPPKDLESELSVPSSSLTPDEASNHCSQQLVVTVLSSTLSAMSNTCMAFALLEDLHNTGGVVNPQHDSYSDWLSYAGGVLGIASYVVQCSPKLWSYFCGSSVN